MARGTASSIQDCRSSDLEAWLRAIHSYQVNNLFIVPLCYFMIAQKSMNFKKNISRFSYNYENYDIEVFMLNLVSNVGDL